MLGSTIAYFTGGLAEKALTQKLGRSDISQSSK